MQIFITVSDPWEVGQAIRWQPLRGELLETVADDHGGRALIKLDQAIGHKGRVYRHVVASPRQQGAEVIALEAGKKLACAFTGIPDQAAESAGPWQTCRWRGGLAFIGDVEPRVETKLPCTRENEIAVASK